MDSGQVLMLANPVVLSMWEASINRSAYRDPANCSREVVGRSRQEVVSLFTWIVVYTTLTYNFK